MTIFINGERAKPTDLAGIGKDKNFLCFAAGGERSQLLEALSLPDFTTGSHSATYFESHKDLDYLSLALPNLEAEGEGAQGVEICLMPGRLLFFSEAAPAVLALMEKLETKGLEGDQLELVLHAFFGLFTEKDAGCLGDIEDEIAALEDAITTDVGRDCTAQISALRKKLLRLKRHYESLVALLEDLEENRNGLLSPEALRLFHFQTDRADRLYHGVLNLRDYVTQVREAYQAQLDISLNKTMKLFTVITAIFLPLTLIVGWYGMNVQMPEYGFRYAYGVIIGASLLIVTALVIYFKRHKWF